MRSYYLFGSLLTVYYNMSGYQSSYSLRNFLKVNVNKNYVKYYLMNLEDFHEER